LPSDAPIGIFDSGVGGLSVLHQVRLLLPDEAFLYVADSRYAPYGRRSAAQVRERVFAISDWLLEQGAKALVVACNTATSVAVDRLRARISTPVIAMEPALKPAATLTRSGIIGVLATAGTLESHRYQRLLDTHGHRLQVLQRHCHHWVELVEQGEVDSARARAMIASEVEPLLAAGADTLVLGCTHFPFLRSLLQQVCGTGVTIIDPAPAVARRVLAQLEALDLRRQSAFTGNAVRCWTSGERTAVAKVFARLGFDRCQPDALPV
jgi:glutamate racemase